MSGTSYGACILHVAPESYVGGPLAFVQTGDEIEIDVAARRIQLKISDEELARRKSAWTRRRRDYYRAATERCSPQHIGQADEGCDFDFLQGTAPDRGAGNSLTRAFPPPACGARQLDRGGAFC